MAPRLPLTGALLLLLLVLAVSAEGDPHAPRLRGSVACLDCAAGHDLSGVVVAVRCAGGGGAGLLRAAQTDSRGAFDVAMPTAAAAASTPCAARVLGAATEQLCASGGFAVARVVPAREPGSSSYYYALGSRLAVFTRCGPATGGGGGGSAVAETTDAADRRQQRRQGDAPRVPEPRPMPPAMQAPAVSAAPRAGGNGSPPPPFGVGGGVPLIFFFPFIPIIGIP
ncbi:unnamed protein product [Urochloa decumbens]|uniref:Uncharacterized protein n=1 Tax=Urochloa decumbens TaxID=240449 RepID=A0ABC9CKV2_9POAL